MSMVLLWCIPGSLPVSPSENLPDSSPRGYTISDTLRPCPSYVCVDRETEAQSGFVALSLRWAASWWLGHSCGLCPGAWPLASHYSPSFQAWRFGFQQALKELPLAAWEGTWSEDLPPCLSPLPIDVPAPAGCAVLLRVRAVLAPVVQGLFSVQS